VAEGSQALCLRELRPWSLISVGATPAVANTGGKQDVEPSDLGPLSMEEPILSGDLSLGSLPSFDYQVNLTLKFNDQHADDGVEEVMEEVPAEDVLAETNLAA
jgi:hypothetical protein